jgi:hypothetical protein
MEFKLTTKEKAKIQKQFIGFKESIKNGEMSLSALKNFRNSTIFEIYSLCGDLTNTSYGFDSSFEKSTKTIMNRLRYAIGGSYIKKDVLGISKSEIDKATKFAEKAIANTKERFQLNSVVNKRYLQHIQ